MENSISKSILYFIIFSLVIISGYITGLLSHNAVRPIEAVRVSTVSLEDVKNYNIDEQPQELAPLPVKEINPFNGGKIIDIPAPRKSSREIAINQVNAEKLKQDPRITHISQASDRDSDYERNYGDKVEISIPGSDDSALSEIEKERLIDNLTDLEASKQEKEKNAQKEAIRNVIDPFAPRKPLAKAPLEGYYTKTASALLPISPKGQAPLWKAYGNYTKIDNTKKPIALILGGLGPDRELTIEAIKTLPSEVTLGFVPYTSNLQELITIAREHGHEVIIEIPMESHDFPRPDAGPLALLVNDSKSAFDLKMTTLLGQVTGYSGVMNYLGSKYLLDAKKSTQFLREMRDKGLYFVENKTIRSAMVSQEAAHNQAPYGASYMIIDEVLSPTMINNALDRLSKVTLVGTPTIGTGYLSRLTLSAIRKKLTAYNSDNIQLISISSFIDARSQGRHLAY